MPMGDGLIRDILHQTQADRVIELVHAGGIVGSFAGRAALEDQNRMRSCGR